ncbi:Rad52/Rad22 family DNA repair protein [Arcobacter peruensis]|uniref:Rad52/Rad22 family DNA repair protein n=1 Tax=Arcobacter peruensis TaxID=2320140 RepID=UPI000F08FFDF|nr:Rad52/Rad22 family DNA repair protein [Arcobacter peruensis]
MFNKEVLKVLDLPLASKRIKSRSKGTVNLSYLEGFDLIETANKVFNFNWSYSVTKLEQVSQETNQNQNIVICYKAIVKILIYDESHSRNVYKEDVGFGTGIAKTLADAHENGAKEAVTDSLKRCLRSLGNQFGNSLYDKSKNHQNNTPNQSQNSNQDTRSPTPQNQQSSFNQYEYQSLFNIGLDVVENKGFLIVMGDNIYAKKDSIKACGFRFDPKTKSWYKQIEQGAA